MSRQRDYTTCLVLSRRDAFLGLDAGTSGCKAVVVDAERTVLAWASAGYAVCRGQDGSVTGDAREWLDAVLSAARQCVAQLQEKTTVAGISITAPAHGAVLVDSDGEPLGPVLAGSDRRPSRVADVLARELGPELYEATWCTPGAGWTLPQLVWLPQSGHVRWDSVRQMLIIKDYLRYRITGELATDPSDAAGTALFDQSRGEWSPGLLQVAHLSADQVPPVRPSTSVAGRVRTDVAAAIGLTPGTPVATGATDTVAELCGLGALAPGSGLVKVASTGTVVAVTAAPCPDGRWLTYPHAAPGRWASFSVHNTAGTSRAWAETQLGNDRAELERFAAQVPPGADGLVFLPFLEGERSPYWDGKMRGGFIGLTSAHGRGHLMRGVLEGVAFSLRMGRDVMRQGGLPVPKCPYLVGGGMESALWRQVLVDILGTPACHAAGNGPALGSALIAHSMANDEPLVDECPSEVIDVQPGPDADKYNQCYARYALLADNFARLELDPVATDSDDREESRAGQN
jgi:xylulokinase